MTSPLTPKEKSVLEFVEGYITENGFSPTYMEIKTHFGFASINSVQNYLKQLAAKGYLHLPGGNSKRAIQIVSSILNNSSRTESLPPKLLQSKGEILSIPLLGKVAAGIPLESYAHDEFIQIPPSMAARSGKTYALKVAGQSMIEDGIFDGDVILVQEQKNASNGEIVVASVNNEATVKRFFNKTKEKGMIELRPANSEMTPLWYSPEDVEIKGVVIGLIRKF